VIFPAPVVTAVEATTSAGRLPAEVVTAEKVAPVVPAEAVTLETLPSAVARKVTSSPSTVTTKPVKAVAAIFVATSSTVSVSRTATVTPATVILPADDGAPVTVKTALSLAPSVSPIAIFPERVPRAST